MRNQLEQLLNRRMWADLHREAEERELGEAIFTEWRDRYVANLLGYMRTYRECKELGLNVGAPYRSIAWCNAAVQLMVIADLDVQDYFLRAAPAEKDRLVAAVLADGYVMRMDGFIAELPPC